MTTHAVVSALAADEVEQDLDQATRVTLVRHGRTAWNAAMRFQGQIDIALDHVGRWQAERVADALSDEHDIARMYASDLGRARDTAMPLAKRLGVELTLEPQLRERHFGAFEGHTYADIESLPADVAERWKLRDPGFAPDGGETLRAFHDRAVSALTRIAATHPGEHVVVVSHGGVLDSMYRAGSRIDLSAKRSWHIGNASIHRMLWTTMGWTVVGWNDEFHLDAPLPGEEANAFLQSQWPEQHAKAVADDALATVHKLEARAR